MLPSNRSGKLGRRTCCIAQDTAEHGASEVDYSHRALQPKHLVVVKPFDGYQPFEKEIEKRRTTPNEG